MGLVVGGGLYRAETLAYQARVDADGGTMTEAGLQFVNSLFVHAAANGKTIRRGYVFGNACNINANVEERILELTGDGEEFTADAQDADFVIHPNCNGMMTVQGRVTQKGRIKLASESLFDNTDWSIFLYFQKPLVSTADSNEATQVVSQYNSFANGRFWISANQTGNAGITPINGTARTIRTTEYGGGGLIEPCAMMVTYNATTRAIVIRDLVNGSSQSTAMPADFTALPTHLAVMQIASAAAGRPNDISYMGLLKYDGIFTDGEMDSVWANFRDNHQLVADYCLIYGNSVTSGADAAELSGNSARNWPQQFSLVANRNNVLVMRPLTMGGKQLYYMRDTDFVKPTGSAYVGSYPSVSTGTAQDSVSYWGPRWKPTILVLDENQNTAASSSINVTYDVDWAGTVGNPGIARHVIDKLRSYGNADMKVVAGTMLAIQSKDINSPFPDLSYADIVANEGVSKFRRNLRDWSQSIRDDAAGLYDAVYDLYADFQGAALSGDPGDGTTPTPNYYPNGDAALYYDDPQHPNFAGHTLMATGYWTAVDSVRA
jgi:lysophospholipase L1-like esterase